MKRTPEQEQILDADIRRFRLAPDSTPNMMQIWVDAIQFPADARVYILQQLTNDEIAQVVYNPIGKTLGDENVFFEPNIWKSLIRRRYPKWEQLIDFFERVWIFDLLHSDENWMPHKANPEQKAFFTNVRMYVNLYFWIHRFNIWLMNRIVAVPTDYRPFYLYAIRNDPNFANQSSGIWLEGSLTPQFRRVTSSKITHSDVYIMFSSSPQNIEFESIGTDPHRRPLITSRQRPPARPPFEQIAMALKFRYNFHILKSGKSILTKEALIVQTIHQNGIMGRGEELEILQIYRESDQSLANIRMSSGSNSKEVLLSILPMKTTLSDQEWRTNFFSPSITYPKIGRFALPPMLGNLTSEEFIDQVQRNFDIDEEKEIFSVSRLIKKTKEAPSHQLKIIFQQHGPKKEKTDGVYYKPMYEIGVSAGDIWEWYQMFFRPFGESEVFLKTPTGHDMVFSAETTPLLDMSDWDDFLDWRKEQLSILDLTKNTETYPGVLYTPQQSIEIYPFQAIPPSSEEFSALITRKSFMGMFFVGIDVFLNMDKMWGSLTFSVEVLALLSQFIKQEVDISRVNNEVIKQKLFATRVGLLHDILQLRPPPSDQIKITEPYPTNTNNFSSKGQKNAVIDNSKSYSNNKRSTGVNDSGLEECAECQKKLSVPMMCSQCGNIVFCDTICQGLYERKTHHSLFCDRQGTFHEIRS